MDDEPDLSTPTQYGSTPAPTEIDRALRRLPARLLNAAALLSTTAIVAAIIPKNPPFRGD